MWDAKPYSVQQVTENLERLVLGSAELQGISVIGEITEYKVAEGSGHIYLTLKDKIPQVPDNRRAILNCTYFKGAQKPSGFALKPGIEVEVYGSLRLYMPRGAYNFNIQAIRKAGEGNLLAEIENRRRRLFAEGLMDPAKRRKLPLLPKRIGIVTGLGTAALRDILKQVLELHPGVEIVIAPALVQGDGAAASLIRALHEICKPEHGCEAVIIGRGGGSMEDLMAFNDEALCRAIAAAPIPVISAVGHQIDHPISDDVADLAAATPTDAAKQLLPDVAVLLEQLELGFRLLERHVLASLESARQRLQALLERPVYCDPAGLFQDRWQLLDDCSRRLSDALKERLQQAREQLHSLKDLALLFESRFALKKAALSPQAERLEALSPLATLQRGYSIVYQKGKIIRHPREVSYDDPLDLRLAGGELQAIPRRD